jgi:hypothetical protein
MYNCKVCSVKEADNFFPTNKSTCKNCISARNKIKRKTVKPFDTDVKEFCLKSGLDFEQICQESEHKIVKNPTLTLLPLTPNNSSELQQLQEKIIILERTIIELTDKINYTNELLISRTEYSDMAIEEIRRREEERYQDQKMEQIKLAKELEIIKVNYYSKDRIIQIINEGFSNFAQINHLKIPDSKNK